MKIFALSFALTACGFAPSPPSLPSLPSAPTAPTVTTGLEERTAGLEDKVVQVGAGAVADAVAPDPDPPAHLGPDGKPVGPGGPLSDAPADCGPAHNHCMRGGGYILTSDNVAPVFRLDGKWYTWRGRKADGHVYRTRPATAATVASARFLFVYREPPSGKATFKQGEAYGVLPRSEKEAVLSGQWRQLRGVYSVDAAAGTFVDDNQMTLKISSAREGVWLEDTE